MKTSQLTFYIPDEQQMLQLGQHLGAISNPPLIIYLKGELGAGKTTLVRGFLRGLNYAGVVKSPTYTLVEGYDLGSIMLFHFDLYRLNDPQELDYLDIPEYFSSHTICLIEWPERGEPFLPSADIVGEIAIADTGRNIFFTALSKQGQTILQKIQQLTRVN